jgi:hypothetical protein
VVERQLWELVVGGSIPPARIEIQMRPQTLPMCNIAAGAKRIERLTCQRHGKGERTRKRSERDGRRRYPPETQLYRDGW